MGTEAALEGGRDPRLDGPDGGAGAEAETPEGGGGVLRAGGGGFIGVAEADRAEGGGGVPLLAGAEGCE